MSNEKLGTVIDGIGASEVIDSSGEVISIEGIDTSSLDVDGLINTEHESKTTTQLIGKVVSYHKIFKKEDCENDRQRYYWDKVEAPYLYIKAVMFDKFGHTGAKDAVAMMMFDKELNKENTRQVGGFSIEGSRLGKEGNRITKCIARKIAWSAYPCNKTCIAEILEEDKPIEITAKQLLAAFKKSEDMENDLKKADYLPIKAKPKQIKPFKPINAATGQHKEASPIEPKRTFESTKAPEKLKIGDQITYSPKKPKSGASIYKDPETWKSETNTIRQSIMKNMSKKNIQHKLMLSEEKDGMRKDILKKMADDAFEHFEKKEELIGFVTSQYPEMTEQEVLAFAKTFAYVQMKKSEMEMVKITDNIEGNDLQKGKIKDALSSIVSKFKPKEKEKEYHVRQKGAPNVHIVGTQGVIKYGQHIANENSSAPHKKVENTKHAMANIKHQGHEVSEEEPWTHAYGGSSWRTHTIHDRDEKKSEVDMVKARVDEGKSVQQKQSDRKDRNSRSREDSIKGVRSTDQGSYNTKPSEKEHPANEAWRKEAGGKLSAINRKNLKQMPNPDLPKSEEMGKAEHPHGYSEKNPKIDIHHKGKYHASTNWSKTLKQAKEKHLERNPEHKPEDVKAYYSNPKPKKK